MWQAGRGCGTATRNNVYLLGRAAGGGGKNCGRAGGVCGYAGRTGRGKLIVERAKKHRDFVEDPSNEFYNTLKFRIVDKIPTSTTGATIVKVFDVEKQNKTKRLGFFEGSILKTDGTYRADATPEEIAEYESLKKELE